MDLILELLIVLRNWELDSEVRRSNAILEESAGSAAMDAPLSTQPQLTNDPQPAISHETLNHRIALTGQ